MWRAGREIRVSAEFGSRRWWHHATMRLEALAFTAVRTNPVNRRGASNHGSTLERCHGTAARRRLLVMSAAATSRMAAISTLVALIGLSGCSFIGLQNPPRRTPGQHTSCTDAATLFSTDLAGAALTGGITVVVAVEDAHSSPVADSKGLLTALIGVPAVILGAVLLSSAGYGHHVQCECEALVRDEAGVQTDAVARFYCTGSSSSSLSSCTETEDECERVRASYSGKQQMTACIAQFHVSCFDYHTRDDAHHTSCAPSTRACTTLRDIIAGRAGVSLSNACTETLQVAQPLSIPAAIERKRVLRAVWDATKTAATAALDGDCASVARLDVEVRALDVNFHDTTFVHEPAIARCLAANTPPSSMTPPSPTAPATKTP